MKKRLESLLIETLSKLVAEAKLPSDIPLNGPIERCRDPQHGDFSTNLAMTLAKPTGMNPRVIAKLIIESLPKDPLVRDVHLAGPGFINFFIDPKAQFSVIPDILKAGARFGQSQRGQGQRIQVEFVSANPTGPLHVGHGRGAAYGAVVANLLAAIGFEVEREYYVNDAGRQMDILAASVWLRYLETFGEPVVFPSNGYRGDYVKGIAEALRKSVGDALRHSAEAISKDLPPDEPQGGDKELHVDALVHKAKSCLGEALYRTLFDAGLNSILEDIREDLGAFGVHYDAWFSERSLMETGAVQRSLDRLQGAGFLYQEEGATWFASTRLGDEKDRVVVRENGQMTYFASDIAYHLLKLEKGFDQIIDVWGADHHGYIPRVRAAIEALGSDQKKLEVLLVQFAVLYRGEEKVQMSTRSGEFVTLRELREEVGKDAARFFYVMRKSDQHMDFDLELATSKTNENPVYYVQYAHARVCSVFRQLEEKGLTFDGQQGLNGLSLLTEPHESALLVTLSRFQELIEQSALQHAPHHLVHYLKDLASELHAYYNAHQFLVPDDALRNARMTLISAARQVIANGLRLLDVSAPETM